MQTVVDIDEKLLSLAEQQARREGKSLGSWVEDGLRALLLRPQPPVKDTGDEVEKVDSDDAFFAALEEIRALGRGTAPHRRLELP